MFRANHTATVARIILRSKDSFSRNVVNSRYVLFSTKPEIVPAFDAPTISTEHLITFGKIQPKSQETLKETSANMKMKFDSVKLQEDSLSPQSQADKEAMHQRQLRIEVEQLQEAADLYTKNFKHLSGMGRGSSMKSTQRLLLTWYEPLVATINKEFDDIACGKWRLDRKHYGPYLVQLPVEKLAVIALTTTLNAVLRTGNLGDKVVNIAQEVSNMVEAEARLVSLKKEKDVPFWQKRLVTGEKPVSSRSLHNFNKRLRKVAQEEEWAPATKIKVGAVLVQAVLDSARHEEGLPSFLYSNNFHQSATTGYARRMGYIRMDPAKYVEFDNLSVKDDALLMPRYMPMLVHPQPWNNRTYSGAYFAMKAPIMKTISSLQTQSVRRGKLDAVLESLDYLGQIGWRINPLVHQVILTCVKENLTIADLPSQVNIKLPKESDCLRPVKNLLAELEEAKQRHELMHKANRVAKLRAEAAALGEEGARQKKITAEDVELPPEADNAVGRKLASAIAALQSVDPEEMRFDERYFKSTCNRIHKRNGELHSSRCDLAIKLDIAQKFKDDVMYFPHNIDFRGRAYPIPPNLSHLGNDFCRGIMMFDKAKPLGEHGFDWLKVHLANLFGYNKVSMQERVAWTDANMDKIRDSVTRPLEGERWWLGAEGPFQALAACAEIVAAVDSGNPSTYMCRLPVHQDGSCNGLQHYAGLGRDAIGGSSVNLVPHDKPQDVYSSVLSKVLMKIEEDSKIPEDDPRHTEGHYARMLTGYVTRKVIKQTVMTSVYGVTRGGARAQVVARLHEAFALDMTTITADKEREVAGAAMYLAGLTLSSLSEMFQSAKNIMDWLGSCAMLLAQQNQVVSWITPLGLPVVQPYRKQQLHSVVTVMQTISLASSADYLPVSSRKQKSAFPPNFVHSMDATHMMMTALKMKKLGLNFASVHDSYWTHACDIPVMSSCLREAFVELYSLPLLEDLRESMVVRFPDVNFPPVPQRGNLDIQLVKDSRYFFH